MPLESSGEPGSDDHHLKLCAYHLRSHLLHPMTAPPLPVSPNLWAEEIPDGQGHQKAEDETSAFLKSR
jgi:hypothetical protein